MIDATLLTEAEREVLIDALFRRREHYQQFYPFGVDDNPERCKELRGKYRVLVRLLRTLEQLKANRAGGVHTASTELG